MATYAIGDVQGCYDELMCLLDHINFDQVNDKLWFCGDIINRGPKSLETIRFIKQLGSHAITVLGNHDLHFLAVALVSNKASKHDTFTDILYADDRDELVDWLRHRKLFHHDQSLNISMVHAGLPPQWSIDDAAHFSKEVEQQLQLDDPLFYFKNMYGNQPKVWKDDLAAMDRYRYITNVFTRMRFCDQQGQPDFKHKGDIGSQPSHLIPWFMHNERASKNDKIVFGHWSTLANINNYNVSALDTGCLWGRKLTSMRLDDQKIFAVDCQAKLKPF